MAVVVSIDAGTTGVRSFALNDKGEQVALAYKEFTQHFPRPGWVEHNPNEIAIIPYDLYRPHSFGTQMYLNKLVS